MLDLFHIVRGIEGSSIQSVVVCAWSRIEMTSASNRIPGDCANVLSLFPFELTSVGIINAMGSISARVMFICLLSPPVLGAKDTK